MKQGDLVGCSMRGGRCEGVICGRGSAERGSPPLVIGGPFEMRVVGVGCRLHSGDAWGSRMMSEVHSAREFEMRRLDGRLFFLDNAGMVRISAEGIGVVGGVEKVSTSGDGGTKVEGMVMERLKQTNVCELGKAYKFSVACTLRSRLYHER